MKKRTAPRRRGRGKGTKPAPSSLLGLNAGHEFRLRLTDEDRQLLLTLLDRALPYPHGDQRWYKMPYHLIQFHRPLSTLRSRIVDPRAGTNRRRRW